jgi:hypothetical protein
MKLAAKPACALSGLFQEHATLRVGADTRSGLERSDKIKDPRQLACSSPRESGSLPIPSMKLAAKPACALSGLFQEHATLRVGADTKSGLERSDKIKDPRLSAKICGERF